MAAVNRSDGRVSSGHGAASRDRLRRKRGGFQSTAVDERCQDEGRGGHGDDERHDDDIRHDEGHDDDVPWTEKYRPGRWDEVVGNSTAVRKLYR